MSISRYNANGKIIAHKLFAENQLNNPVSIIKTHDRNFLLTAETGTGENTALWLIKLDQNGDTIWTKAYPDFYPKQTLQLSDSSLLFYGGGYYYPTATSGSCHFLKIIKTDRNGHLRWEKTIKENYYETTGSVVETSDGKYLFSSIIQPVPNGAKQLYLFELDQQGNRTFERKSDFPADRDGVPILLRANKHLFMYAAGRSAKTGDSLRSDIVIIQLLQ